MSTQELVERDRVEEGPRQRKGVPQAQRVLKTR